MLLETTKHVKIAILFNSLKKRNSMSKNKYIIDISGGLFCKQMHIKLHLLKHVAVLKDR